MIFEHLPASDQRADAVYIREVEQCAVYLDLLELQYGFEDDEGISPTEREFDHATEREFDHATEREFDHATEREFDHATAHYKTRLIFLTDHSILKREAQQLHMAITRQSYFASHAHTARSTY